jgi:hypothetical protein
MEDWRSYTESIESKKVFERYDYITGVLGIPLPINEVGHFQLTEELKKHIIHEHLLYEGFIGSLIDKAKESAGKIKNLVMTLAEILSDENALTSFINLLNKKVIFRIASSFHKAFNKLAEVGLVRKVSENFEALLEAYKKMDISWKKAIAGITLALMLQFAYDKVEGLLKDVMSGEASKQFIAFLKGQFVKFFGNDLLNRAMEHITDIKAYLGWIGPAIGGVSFVANTLTPVTSRIQAPPLVLPDQTS